MEEQAKYDLAQKTQEDSFLTVVERLSVQPNIDVEKIKQIMDMQERVLNRNASQAFSAAMVRAQSRIKSVKKEAKNEQTNSMYATHEAIISIVSPIYTSEGFSLSFYEGTPTKADHIRIMCDVMHEQGHTTTRYVDMAIDIAGIKGSPNKTMVHAEGSSFKYGMRYLTCLVFNIPTGDDDDGNTAGNQHTEELATKDDIDYFKEMIAKKNIDEIEFLKNVEAESFETIPKRSVHMISLLLRAAKGRPKEASEPGSNG